MCQPRARHQEFLQGKPTSLFSLPLSLPLSLLFFMGSLQLIKDDIIAAVSFSGIQHGHDHRTEVVPSLLPSLVLSHHLLLFSLSFFLSFLDWVLLVMWVFTPSPSLIVLSLQQCHIVKWVSHGYCCQDNSEVILVWESGTGLTWHEGMNSHVFPLTHTHKHAHTHTPNSHPTQAHTHTRALAH